ncbi:acyltransferase family protein [Herbaspirillum chlorophenolicum]|uniref:acyltransferase family protein n=1 Tax=Herbaspirillum chlorophenolicum TaxID=211589 RepID=UPI00067D4D1F|nr:acyltransferase [Herbaspirillum chlorophenolicum]
MRPPAGATPAYGYIPGLDGLRACAVMLVLFAHLGFNHVIPGGFGVTLFFFISGMLITRLLLAEHEAKGRIGIGNFYARRAFRLYPALLAAIVLGTLAFNADGGITPWGKIASALFYYANYYGIYIHFGQGRDGFDPFSILWSLSIEEQYYLLFPLLCAALAPRLRTFSLTLGLGVLAVLLWRSGLHFTGASSDRIYMGTDTRIDSILYGAWLTLILANDTQQHWVRFSSGKLVQAVCVLMLLASFLIRNDHFRDTLRYSLQGLALMPLITAICFTHAMQPVTAALESRPGRKLGAWSYSLYLYHPIAIVLSEILWGPGSLGVGRIGLQHYMGFALTALVLSFALATASYYGLEQPFMNLRKRFGAHIVND